MVLKYWHTNVNGDCDGRKKNPVLFLMSIFLFFILHMNAQLPDVPDVRIYDLSWPSLSEHDAAPEWFQDAKLGVYFHWGVYSVPAFAGAWYPWHMYRTEGHPVEAYHREHYGDPKDFNYHDFVPLFTGKEFDAENWADLFKASGAKFAGLCALHHDGFAMWASEVNPWNAKDRGPRKDVTGALEKAIKANDMKFITTFHHARTLQRHADDPGQWQSYDSHFAYHPDYATSSTDPDLSKLYGNMPKNQFYAYWFDELKEVIDQYAPDIVWFDSWLNLIPEAHRKEFTAYYLKAAKEKGQQVVIAAKQFDLPHALSVQDIEQGGKKDLSPIPWMTDITISTHNWSYVNDMTYKSPELVLRNMIDAWSKNGTVLLNISPTKDGVIPQEQRNILHRIGDWLSKYGEAVFGTRTWSVNGFGTAKATNGTHGGQSATTAYSAEDVRFTFSKDKKSLYLFFLGRPEPGTVVPMRSFGAHRYPVPSPIKNITVLGSDIEVPWKLTSNHLFLTIPGAPMDEMATVFKIALE